MSGICIYRDIIGNVFDSTFTNVFYRAACNADAVLWWEFCPSVCPSVRLSVCHTRDCDKTV